MAGIKHSLVIEFDSDDDKEIFRGKSYIQKNICDDEVVICGNKIEIDYERNKEMAVEKVLDSPKSYIRMHLQRALGFYIAVLGQIPECKSVTYTVSGNKYKLKEIAALAKKWSDYKIDTCLKSEACEKVFNGKRDENIPLYNAVSYFVKAQLADYYHDSFRCAWSGLNALYTNMVENAEASEEVKLGKLGDFIMCHEMSNSCDYVAEIDNNKFWNKLEWFYFLENGFKKHGFQKYYNDYFSKNAKKDAVLGEALFSKLTSKVMTDKNKVDIERLKEKAKVYSKKKNEEKYIHYKDRVEFLVRKYCYFKRNRSMHAGQEYPLFIISEDSENYVEPILTKLLILAIKDIIEEKYA